MVIYFFKDIAISGQGGTAASEKYPGGSPFTCRGEGKRKIGNPIHNVPLNPPLAKQDKEILDAWFYSCKAEKCPENPPSNMQRREEKVGNPTKSTHKPPLSQNTRKSLEFGFFCPKYLWYGATTASPLTELIYMWLGLFARLVCFYRRKYKYHWYLQNSTIWVNWLRWDLVKADLLRVGCESIMLQIGRS